MDYQATLLDRSRNSIEVVIEGSRQHKTGDTRFGGRPDVPADFQWPYYEGENFDGVVQNRPLAFFAQFNCAELTALDSEKVLPDHGVLSFFYEMDTMCGGFDPKDSGCARVFWFEDLSTLSAADYPLSLAKQYRFPEIAISLATKKSFPTWEDFSELFPDEYDFEKFDEARTALLGEESDNISKILGWPDIIQNSMAVECELVSRGFYTGNDWNDLPEHERINASDAVERWRLLFQLDTVEQKDFELMFGDSGRIYFYITEADLMARRFDRIWLLFQCY